MAIVAISEGRLKRLTPTTIVEKKEPDPGFSFAFQPIVNTHTRTVYSYEALVRGLNNESAYEVFSRYSPDAMAELDAKLRVGAIETAARIGVDTNLNLNLLPRAALDAVTGLDSTIEAANRTSFSLDRLIVEVTEVDAIENAALFADVLNAYRHLGITLAIDDFGAGYAGLSLLSGFQPDIVKLDMGLVRGIESDGPRQAIVRGILQVCEDLGIDFIVEGVETLDEYAWFNDIGAYLFQGYLFAKPMFEQMPPPDFPDLI